MQYSQYTILVFSVNSIIKGVYFICIGNQMMSIAINMVLNVVNELIALILDGNKFHS